MPNIHKLNNGLTVITDYIDTVETVSVGMWNKVGARNEKEKVNGDLAKKRINWAKQVLKEPTQEGLF